MSFHHVGLVFVTLCANIFSVNSLPFRDLPPAVRQALHAARSMGRQYAEYRDSGMLTRMRKQSELGRTEYLAQRAEGKKRLADMPYEKRIRARDLYAWRLSRIFSRWQSARPVLYAWENPAWFDYLQHALVEHVPVSIRFQLCEEMPFLEEVMFY